MTDDLTDLEELRRIIADDILDHILNPLGCKCGRDSHDPPDSGDYGIREFVQQRNAADLPIPTSITYNIQAGGGVPTLTMISTRSARADLRFVWAKNQSVLKFGPKLTSRTPID